MHIVSCDGPWWRHQMETFSALLAFCNGNSPVPVEVPSQRPVTRSFDIFFDLCLNKRLSKQSRRWWFETPSRPLWHHCSVFVSVFSRRDSSITGSDGVTQNIMGTIITGLACLVWSIWGHGIITSTTTSCLKNLPCPICRREYITYVAIGVVR